VLLLVVWVVVVVLCAVVLGAVAHGVLGARARLAREVTAFEQEVQPLLDRVAATAEKARSEPDRTTSEG
jgi:hypothetical protein